jgi:PTS system ascorbate-specific IIC component
VITVLVAVVVFAAAVIVQKKLVDGHWDPAPGRVKGSLVPAGDNGRSGGAGDSAGAPATVSDGFTVAGKYPRIAPPKGAPVPPPPPGSGSGSA